MSLHYTLELATARTPTEVAFLLQEIVTTQPSDVGSEEERAFRPLFQAHVVDSDPEFSSSVAELLHIRPTVRVIFTGKPREFDNPSRWILRRTLHYLSVDPESDAALLFNGEIPVFLRRNASYLLNANFSVWENLESQSFWFPDGATVADLPII